MSPTSYDPVRDEINSVPARATQEQDTSANPFGIVFPEPRGQTRDGREWKDLEYQILRLWLAGEKKTSIIEAVHMSYYTIENRFEHYMKPHIPEAAFDHHDEAVAARTESANERAATYETFSERKERRENAGESSSTGGR